MYTLSIISKEYHKIFTDHKYAYIFTTCFGRTPFLELYYWPGTYMCGHYDIRPMVTIYPHHIHVFPEDWAEKLSENIIMSMLSVHVKVLI
jgi:hypothetical protein